MKPIGKTILAATLSIAMVMPTVSSAEAGPRHGRGYEHGGPYFGPDYHMHRKHHRKHRRHERKRKNDNVGAAVAAGIIGLAAGAILLNATRPSYAAPPINPGYAPAPPRGTVYGQVGYQPWSPAWYQYCTAKYRSFNPSTGTYTTYRGEQKFCQ